MWCRLTTGSHARAGTGRRRLYGEQSGGGEMPVMIYSAVGYAWNPSSAQPPTRINVQADRIRRQVASRDWTLVDSVHALRQSSLQDEYVVMTPEALTILETQYAETWRLA